MRRTDPRSTAWIGALLLLVAIGSLSAGPGGANGEGDTIVAGITEGPDPIPQVFWLPGDNIYPSIDTGPLRSDGRPHMTLDPDSHPVVTWAYREGIKRDIALLRWTGARWDGPHFVTHSFIEELDPRAFVSFFDLYHVVWWIDGSTEKVYYTSGHPGEYGYSRIVANGRRPSVVQWGSSVLVAFERDAGGTQQEIVIATKDMTGQFSLSPIFQVPRSEPLDVVLHLEENQLWMDWIASDSEMAYSTNVNGFWTTPILVPLTSQTWAETEAIRQSIRQLVIAP